MRMLDVNQMQSPLNPTFFKKNTPLLSADQLRFESDLSLELIWKTNSIRRVNPNCQIRSV